MTEEERKQLSGKRVQQVRKEIAKLSTEKFAELLERTSKSIMGYEQGQTLIPVEQAAKISQLYGVSLDWLYGVTDEMNDDTGKMLAALCEFIKIEPHNGLDPKVKINKDVYSFIEQISRAKAFKGYYGLPEDAYIAWIESIKEKFRQNFQKPNSDPYHNIPGTYYFVPEWVYEKVIPERRGVNIPNPPTGQ